MFWNTLIQQVNAGQYREKTQDDGANNSGVTNHQKRMHHHYTVEGGDEDNRYKLVLTQREAECLYHVMRGKTFVQTAQELKLSCRTVEYYLNNVKAKFKVKKLGQLKTMAWESSFATTVLVQKVFN